MSQKANYFKIGLFVIGATIVLIAAIIFLATGGIGEAPLYVETYFDESVQGLSEGAPVTYRGVKIGNVEKIDFTSRIYNIPPTSPEYHTKGRYVYVLINVRPMVLEQMPETGIENHIRQLTEDGLRLQLKSQGITGLVVLQAEYFNPDENPPTEVPWEPKYPYLPSTASLFTRLSDALSSLGKRIEGLDIEGVVDNMNELLVTANTTLEDADLGGIGQEVEGLVSDLRGTNSRIQEFLSDSSVDGMQDDLAASISGIRRIIEDSEGEIAGSLTSFDSAMANLDDIVEKIDSFLGEKGDKEGALADISGTLDGIRVSIEGLPEAIKQFNGIVQNANLTLAVQRRHITEVLITLDAVLKDIQALTEEAKQNPAGLLFSEPPPRSEIDEK